MEENSKTIDIVHTYTTQQEAEADARNGRFGFKGMHTHTHTLINTLTPTHILDMSYSDRFFIFSLEPAGTSVYEFFTVA